MAGLKAEEFTVDAFHRGRFRLVQPSKGHRAGMDAMILAAAVPNGFSGRLADLGAGAGAAGLAVASRCSEARVTLVEQSPQMVDCARRGLALAENRGLAERVEVLEADVTLSGRPRAAAGLADRSFDFAIMNPPFNAPADRVTPDELKRQAHVMEDDVLEAWVRTAAAIVTPRGGLTIVARPASLHALLSAMEGRFGSTAMLPVHPRADAAAIRIIVRAWLGARGGLEIRPSLTLHGQDGKLLPHADALINGRESLFGD